MKKQFAAIAGAFVLSLSVAAETVTQQFFIDFGDPTPGRGEPTVGPDHLGHYWTNVVTSGNNYVYPGVTFKLLNSENQETDYDILINTRFMSNGMGANGGLENPEVSLLAELAVKTATEDYFFMEGFQDYNTITFRHLDPDKAYRFHAYGMRATNEVRIGNYQFRGWNEWNGDLQFGGSGCGEAGWNGNNNRILVSGPVFPDESGNIAFTIRRVQNMCHINAMWIEELDGVDRPYSDYVLAQSMFIDFGESQEDNGGRDHGHLTTHKPHGNSWNNIYATANDVIPGGSSWPLVNSLGQESGMTAVLKDDLHTNGYVANGGIEQNHLNLGAQMLGSLAVVSASEDYCYVTDKQQRVDIEFTGADPDKVYRIKAFGSRITNETGDRCGWFGLEGSDSWKTLVTFSGRCIGGRDENGKDVHGNVRNLAVSDFIRPTADGKLNFFIERKTGLSHLNMMLIEEFDMEKPIAEISALTVKGEAVENGEIIMKSVGNGVFESYLKLGNGSYNFAATTVDGDVLTLGDGLKADADDLSSDTEQIVRLTADTRNGAVSLFNINSVNVKGTIAPENTVLDYEGNGVWRASVTLDKIAEGKQYVDRNIYFAFNDDNQYAIRRTAGTHKVNIGFGENIRLNNGTYTIMLDMSAAEFEISSDIDPYRISVFGSSVANGQGASDFQGYAYLFGEQLKERAQSGASIYPFHTSGVSIGGNRTTHLLQRYDDVLHDFGKFVIIGLSMGNEGIHGAADQQGVFNGFRDNMLEIISKLRNDGKTPVVVNNYTRADYNADDYKYIKQMNLLIHQWDVPSVNSLGAIDDGAGHWAAGHIADDFHPNDAGHQEFMYAIVPSLFDALTEGKELPVRDLSKSYVLSNGDTFEFVPEAKVHPFTVSAHVKGNGAGDIFSLILGNNKFTGSVSVNTDGTLTYLSPTEDALSTSVTPLDDSEWHYVTLTHYYACGVTHLYVDETLQLTVREKLPLTKIIFGDADNYTLSREFSEISFWRSGMSGEEISAHCKGDMLKSSMELYSPVELVDDNVENKAQSLNTVSFVKSEKTLGIHGPCCDEGVFRVEADKGMIRITCDEALEIPVFAADGRLVTRIVHHTPVSVTHIEPGIYIIRDNKIIVR